MQKNATLLLLLCLTTLLSSCANTPAIIETNTVKVTIPDELLTCEDFPEAKPVALQSEFAELTLNAWKAWADCFSKVQAIKEKVTP